MESNAIVVSQQISFSSAYAVGISLAVGSAFLIGYLGKRCVSRVCHRATESPAGRSSCLLSVGRLTEALSSLFNKLSIGHDPLVVVQKRSWNVSFSKQLRTVSSREESSLAQIMSDRIGRRIEDIFQNASRPFPKRVEDPRRVSVCWGGTRSVEIDHISTVVTRTLGLCIAVLLRSKNRMSVSHVINDVSFLRDEVLELTKDKGPVEAFLAGGWSLKSEEVYRKIVGILEEASINVREDLCFKGMQSLSFERAGKCRQGTIGLSFAGFDKDGNPHLRFRLEMIGVQKKNMGKYAYCP